MNMRVKAIATIGKDLSPETLKQLHYPETDFQLIIGDVYTVYGINVWSSIVHYLTYDKWHIVPSWNPAELFVVENKHKQRHIWEIPFPMLHDPNPL